MTFIDIELTTYCNAKCAFCVRTECATEPQYLDFEILKKLPKFEQVHFIGVRGDAIFYPKLFEAILLFNSKNSFVRIHTNASAHSKDWWKALANIMKRNRNHILMFALDGLEDTHSIYRKGTNFKKIITNVKTFIENGADASVQTLVFKHNQHQLEDIKKLCKDIGVKNMWIRKSRSYNEELLRPTIGMWKTRHEMSSERENLEIICGHIVKPCMYLRVDGQLRPCCFMGCDEWKPEKRYHLKYHSFNKIYNGPQFKYIRENYQNIERCQEKCRCTFNDIVSVEKLNK